MERLECSVSVWLRPLNIPSLTVLSINGGWTNHYIYDVKDLFLNIIYCLLPLHEQVSPNLQNTKFIQFHGRVNEITRMLDYSKPVKWLLRPRKVCGVSSFLYKIRVSRAGLSIFFKKKDTGKKKESPTCCVCLLLSFHASVTISVE